MCKVKGCPRPSFLGGLCGHHALQGWTPPSPRREARRTKSAAALAPRSRIVARPASG